MFSFRVFCRKVFGSHVVTATRCASGAKRLAGAATLNHRRRGSTALAAVTYALVCASSAIAQQAGAAGNTPDSKNIAEGNMTYRYDDLHRIIGWTDPHGLSAEFKLTADGKIESAKASGGFEARQSYDAAGRVISIERPGGGHITLKRDANGDVTSVIDPLGRENRFTYDASQHLLTRTDAAGKVVKYAHAPGTAVFERRAADGSKITVQYDAAGKLIAADNGTFSVRRTLDAAGKVVRVITRHSARACNTATTRSAAAPAWSIPTADRLDTSMDRGVSPTSSLRMAAASASRGTARAASSGSLIPTALPAAGPTIAAGA